MMFIAAIALVIRVIFFSGVFAVDDFNYLRYAAQFLKGSYDLDQVSYWHGTRFLVFVPVSLFFSLFGVSEITAVAWSLVTSLSALVLIFRIGRLMHSREAGFYAALLASFLPVMVNESTWVTPGPVLELVIAVSVLLFLQAEHSSSRRRSLFFFSGAVFSLMPFAGNIGLVSSIFFILSFLFYKRGELKGYGIFFIGLAVVAAAGAILYWVETGNPFRLAEISGKIFSTETQGFRPFFYLKSLTRPVYSQGGIIYLVCLALATLVISRRRGVLLAFLWFFVTWLLIEFGSSSLTEYRPLFKQVRYMSVLTLPAVLCGGMGIAEMRSIVSNVRNSLVKRYFGGSAVVTIFSLFIASSLLYLYQGSGYIREQRKFIKAAGSVVRQHEGDVIYVTHWLWNSRVSFFMGYKDDYFPSGYHPDHALAMETADPDSKNLYVQLLKDGDRMRPGILLFDKSLFEYSCREERVSGMIGPGEIPYYLQESVSSMDTITDIDMGGDRRLKIVEVPEMKWSIPDRGH